ncbi:MAG: hypothetical protein HY537_08735 [Deltaproteobacteria bacterium]|nr:hypothetical protein [Deltaproteobacteria bacterium]
MRILYFQSHSPCIALGEACFALTPKVWLADKKHLFLELSSTAQCFKGEKRQLEFFTSLAELWSTQGILVLTDRPQWSAAFATQNTFLAPGESEAALLKLPIERLAYCGNPSTFEAESLQRQALVAFMKRVGLKTIFDFTRLNATAISRRFGRLGIELKDIIQNESEIFLPPLIPSETIVETMDAQEIISMEALLFCIRQMLVKIEARLRARMLSLTSLKLRLHLEQGKLEKTLSFSEPQTTASELIPVIRELLNNLRWDSPLLNIDVEVLETAPCILGQLSLFDLAENRYAELSKYLEKWQIRFGKESVGFATLLESHVPERSWKITPTPPRENVSVDLSHRPVFLYSSPRPYSPPQNARLVPLEKIIAEWWDEGSYRMYFISQTPTEKLWVFWDFLKQQWFVHGSFH